MVIDYIARARLDMALAPLRKRRNLAMGLLIESRGRRPEFRDRLEAEIRFLDRQIRLLQAQPKAPPDDTGGGLTSGTAERLPRDERDLPHGKIDLTDVDGTIKII